jgi:hypothetical protein
MDKLEFAEGLGRKIIKDQHQFFDSEECEDLEHITTIKRIIVSISDFLSTEGVPEDKISDLAENWRVLARHLYIDSCIKNRDEDEDKDVVTEESEVWFDYIYENEEYPE